METSWLIERLENPALLKKGDEHRLRELIASYPYFSAPYLLLARSLHEQKHPAFEQLLPLISLQAFDRKRLFKLIHEEVEVKVEVKVKDEESTVNSRQSTEPEAEKVLETSDEESAIVRHTERREPVLSPPKESTTDDTPIDRRAGIRFSVDFAEIEKPEDEAEATLHEELQEIPFLLTMDHGPWTIAEGAEEMVEEMRGLGDEVKDGVNEEPDIDNKSSSFAEIATEDNTNRIDFIHWLEKLQPVKKGEDKVEVDEVSMVNSLQSTEEIAEANSIQPTANSLQPTANSLIDKFIETNPSVSRVKERFYDPAVQAKESERLDDNLMTETLARIFVKQEKYERAIEAYRKLQLKYPEKSDYFAALISEINSKIN